jgi:hypothetical protein
LFLFSIGSSKSKTKALNIIAYDASDAAKGVTIGSKCVPYFDFLSKTLVDKIKKNSGQNKFYSCGLNIIDRTPDFKVFGEDELNGQINIESVLNTILGFNRKTKDTSIHLHLILASDIRVNDSTDDNVRKNNVGGLRFPNILSISEWN